MELYSNLLNASLGALIGCYGTLIGTGGGFLLVPLFLLLHQLPHEIAVGTSLAIVTANALSGASRYMWQGNVDYKSGALFALATIPGALGGALLTELFTGPAFSRTFGGFLVLIAVYLFLRKRPDPGREERPAVNLPLGVGISGIVGVMSSWLGIGGGVLHVPAMTEILRFPVHLAIGTSQFILMFTALAGAITHAMKGHLNGDVALSTGIGAVLGAQLGAWLAPRLKGLVVLRYLSLALVVVGLRLLFG